MYQKQVKFRTRKIKLNKQTKVYEYISAHNYNPIQEYKIRIGPIMFNGVSIETSHIELLQNEFISLFATDDPHLPHLG